ncbi:MAG: NADH-quinone oxidoreductase subunit L [Gracilibacteraceae bacterium]|jgi:ech hydrogenase subunit A|nr:NADH-quinone oxidoreductase subunit L [Gracilibacteraceae bacterium]
MQALLLFLILFPAAVAFLLLATPKGRARQTVVSVSAAVIAAASIILAALVLSRGAPVYFAVGGHAADLLIFAAEVALGVIVTVISIRRKQYLAMALMLAGLIMTVVYEVWLANTVHAESNLFADNLSVVMTLIIGVIGSLIAFFALGYMEEYHHHHEDVPDRSNFFFFIVFAFLGAMNGLIFANNLVWLFFFWEVTTFCSFFLIGYGRDALAVRNSFLALKLNLCGGLAFSAALFFLTLNAHAISLSELHDLPGGAVLLPVALLAFAGLTKSAQMPFSSWLLGAMVAPTPVSALLHSSTMVKAGVYLVIRLSPVFAYVDGGKTVGLFVALVGAVTFLLTSCMAISQNDAKRVLAYSTIANLGLIIVCAGIGNHKLAWAAVMLVIFHAIAKSLLFLSVGTAEHLIGSRQIESMDGLAGYLPRVAAGMVVGIAGMFLAPFGMLISKWATLEGLVDANPILTIFVAFGSAVTLMFWVKWLGKILIVKSAPENVETRVPRTQSLTLAVLSVMTAGVCVLFPLISKYVLEPFIFETYRQIYWQDMNNIATLLIMMATVVVLTVPLVFPGKQERHFRPQYLAGANLAEKEKFHGAMGQDIQISLKSLYLQGIFGESRLFPLGVLSTLILIIIMLGVVV